MTVPAMVMAEYYGVRGFVQAMHVVAGVNYDDSATDSRDDYNTCAEAFGLDLQLLRRGIKKYDRPRHQAQTKEV